MAWVSGEANRVTGVLDLLLGYPIAGGLLRFSGTISIEERLATALALGGMISVLLFFFQPIERGLAKPVISASKEL